MRELRTNSAVERGCRQLVRQVSDGRLGDVAGKEEKQVVQPFLLITICNKVDTQTRTA